MIESRYTSGGTFISRWPVLGALSVLFSMLAPVSPVAAECFSCDDEARAVPAAVTVLASLDLPKLRKPKLPKPPKIGEILPDKDDLPTKEDITDALTVKNKDCGGDEQPVCPITVQLIPCDQDLMADDGICYVCGAVGDRACPVTVRVPSCDACFLIGSLPTPCVN